jgi:hypothetical protein
VYLSGESRPSPAEKAPTGYLVFLSTTIQAQVRHSFRIGPGR